MAWGFEGRKEAGGRLAEVLMRRGYRAPVVLGLARGGVAVAAPIARMLVAPLDVLVVRKVGAPNHPEFGIGAVGPGGSSYADERTLLELGITREVFDQLAQAEHREVVRRLTAYRDGKPPVLLDGRMVIVVDDGLATGVTAIAAVRYVRSLNAQRVVLAVPVGSPEAVVRLRKEVDEVVCLLEPGEYRSVGQWYEDFTQTTDREVVRLLGEGRTLST